MVSWWYRYREGPGGSWNRWQRAGREITPRSQTVRGLTNRTGTEASLYYGFKVQGRTAADHGSVTWTVDQVVPLASLPDPPNEAPDKPSGPPAVTMKEGGTDTGADYTSTDRRVRPSSGR